MPSEHMRLRPSLKLADGRPTSRACQAGTKTSYLPFPTSSHKHAHLLTPTNHSSVQCLLLLSPVRAQWSIWKMPRRQGMKWKKQLVVAGPVSRMWIRPVGCAGGKHMFRQGVAGFGSSELGYIPPQYAFLCLVVYIVSIRLIYRWFSDIAMHSIVRESVHYLVMPPLVQIAWCLTWCLKHIRNANYETQISHIGVNIKTRNVYTILDSRFLVGAFSDWLPGIKKWLYLKALEDCLKGFVFGSYYFGLIMFISILLLLQELTGWLITRSLSVPMHVSLWIPAMSKCMRELIVMCDCWCDSWLPVGSVCPKKFSSWLEWRGCKWAENDIWSNSCWITEALSGLVRCFSLSSVVYLFALICRQRPSQCHLFFLFSLY